MSDDVRDEIADEEAVEDTAEAVADEVAEAFADDEEAVGAAPEGPVYMPPVPLPPKPMFRSLRPGEEPKPLSQAELDRRWAKIQKLRWVDSRSTEEIIADIVGSRTMGREVNL